MPLFVVFMDESMGCEKLISWWFWSKERSKLEGNLEGKL